MNLLKKIGMIAGNVAGIVAGIGPVASMMFPAHAGQIEEGIGIFRQILAIIQQAELIGNTLTLSGPDKLKLSIAQIGQLIKMTDLVKTNKIKDQALFDKAIAGFAQASYDLQSSLDDSHVKEANVAA